MKVPKSCSSSPTSSGSSSSQYEELGQALNAVFDALFYIELVVKDRKLAQPLGLMDCSSDLCPEDLESPWAHQSLPNIRSNFVVGRSLMTGGDSEEAVGFVDLLELQGEGELAVEMLARLDQAIATLDAIELTGRETLETDPESLLEVHTALKSFTDLLKTDMALALLLQIPQEAAGDSD